MKERVSFLAAKLLYSCNWTGCFLTATVTGFYFSSRTW